MFFKQFMKKAQQEQFDVERFEIVVDLRGGEIVSISNIYVDKENKQVHIVANNLSAVDEDEDYLGEKL